MDIVTTKVWRQTLDKLKVLAALRRKTMLSVLDELVDKAMKEEDEKHFKELRTMIKRNDKEPQS